MRWLTNWFIAKDLKANNSALSANLQQQLDGDVIEAIIFEINNLKENNPELAQAKIARIHRAYYENKQSVIRAEADLKQYYQSFLQDLRSKTTYLLGLGVGVLSYVVDALLVIEVPEGCPEQEVMFSTMTKSIGICMGMLSLQALHYLNYQNEAQQYKDKIHNHHQQKEFSRSILEGVDKEALLDLEPEVEAKLFQAY